MNKTAAPAPIRRPGSGRTKGSFSFITVTLAELNSKFADPNQMIVIGRKFGEPFFKDKISAPAASITGSIEGRTPESKAEVKEVNLDDI